VQPLRVAGAPGPLQQLPLNRYEPTTSEICIVGTAFV
jgi:hypothetical protein